MNPTEKPILFQPDMVAAILRGKKTMTRRIVKAPNDHASPKGSGKMFYDLSRAWKDGRPETGEYLHVPFAHPLDGWEDDPRGDARMRVYAPVEVGTILWVREKSRAEELESGEDGVRYLADGSFREIENTEAASSDWCDLNDYRGKRGATVPSIHMPRWACRLRLEVTAVRVERVAIISTEDALAEGVDSDGGDDVHRNRSSVENFKALWERINGVGSWAANPWVWVYTFRKLPPSPA